MPSRLLLLLLVAAGCQRAEIPPPQAPSVVDVGLPAEPASHAPLTETLWLSTDDADAPGTLRAYLPDGSMLMTSCAETYRIARWRTDPDGAIAWTEDTAEVRALVDELTDTTLRLRVIAGPDTLARAYRASDGEAVCPDLR